MKVEDRGVKFPLTPGHEVACIVDRRSRYGVLRISGLFWSYCLYCGEENSCPDRRHNGQAGGLGLMAVQLAKAITNSRVIIVDINDNKLQKAKS